MMTEHTPMLSDSLDFAAITANLERADNGIWYGRNTSCISYPDDQHAECYALEDSSFWFKHRANCIISAMERFPIDSLLYDVGGGNGHVSLAMQSSGIPTVLVEPGEEGALNAKSRGVQHIICSTLQDAGFQPATIPAIGLFDVLEHIEDDGRFLSQLHAALIPGGRLYITVPAFGLLWSTEDTAAGHYRRYSLSQLHVTLATTGFDVDYSTYFFAFLPIPILFMRTIPSKLGLRNKRLHGRNRREHSQPSSSTGTVLSTALSMETNAIYQGKRLPVGGSCLIVATAHA